MLRINMFGKLALFSATMTTVGVGASMTKAAADSQTKVEQPIPKLKGFFSKTVSCPLLRKAVEAQLSEASSEQAIKDSVSSLNRIDENGFYSPSQSSCHMDNANLT